MELFSLTFVPNLVLKKNCKVFSDDIECGTKAAITLEFSFNRKWFSWMQVHFIKNAECSRNIRENGRGLGRTYFADKFALLNYIGETFS